MEKIQVICDDGITKFSFILEGLEKGSFIPPGIWAKQKYLMHNISLMICDLLIDESDYVRNFDYFKTHFAKEKNLRRSKQLRCLNPK